MSSIEIRVHLFDLALERLTAEQMGLSADRHYMADLEEEIAAYRVAYVGASITEIAILRGELFGRDQG
jgi:hypothetical protein